MDSTGNKTDFLKSFKQRIYQRCLGVTITLDVTEVLLNTAVLYSD